MGVELTLSNKKSPACVCFSMCVWESRVLHPRLFSRFDNNEGNSSFAGAPKPPLSRKELENPARLSLLER